MGELFAIIVATVLVNNFVLVQFLGLCPFMGVTQRLEGTIGLCFATTFVLTLASALSWCIHHFLLVPFDLEYLRIVVFIVVIASVVQVTEILLRAFSPLLCKVLGIFLPLITTNCAILGVALLNIQRQHTFVEAIFYGFGAAAGFSLVLVALSAQRERLELAAIPRPFQGAAIGLISAAIMALAFIGFTGLIRS